MATFRVHLRSNTPPSPPSPPPPLPWRVERPREPLARARPRRRLSVAMGDSPVRRSSRATVGRRVDGRRRVDARLNNKQRAASTLADRNIATVIVAILAVIAALAVVVVAIATATIISWQNAIVCIRDQIHTSWNED